MNTKAEVKLLFLLFTTQAVFLGEVRPVLGPLVKVKGTEIDTKFLTCDLKTLPRLKNGEG